MSALVINIPRTPAGRDLLRCFIPLDESCGMNDGLSPWPDQLRAIDWDELAAWIDKTLAPVNRKYGIKPARGGK